MTKRLTAKQVENAKPQATRIEVPDTGCKGLYLVLQPSGSRSWAVRYRFAGQPRKLTLEPKPGEPALTLATARKLAADALHKVEQGIDPAKQKRDRIAAGHEEQATREADTVEHLAAAFVEKYAKPRNRSWRETEAIFRRDILTNWKSRSVHDIEREDVENLIYGIADNRPIMANRVLSAVRKWFGWMTGKGRSSLRTRLKVNPAIGIEPPGQEKSRDRVLSNDEIAALWKAADADDRPFGAIVKLLLLTGQRRSEVAEMRRDELDLDRRLWSMSSERTKNKLPHAVPLSDQAMAVLASVAGVSRDYVFSMNGGRPIGDGFARLKRRIDAQMNPTAPWVLHDIRRTVATGMADIGIQPHIVEAVLNHVSGHKAGVAGVYNRAVYAEEKAAALVRWGDHVEGLVTGTATKVIPLRGWRP
jgi:integrase